MTSHKEDEIIELVQYSSTSSKSNESTKHKKFKNKIGSPPSTSPTKLRDVSDAIFIKPRPPLPPVSHPKNRRIIRHPKTATSVSTSDLTSESSDLSEMKDRHQNISETTSVITSKSDPRSYREKIKDRFRSVKQQAGKSLTRAHGSDFRSKSDKIIDINRSIEFLRKESRSVDEELKGYRNGRLREDDDEITRCDAHTFFCEQTPQKTTVEEDASVVVATLPELLSFNLKLSERDNFWTPKGKEVEANIKVENSDLRYLEEEGFYTSEKPDVPSFHLNLLEERLIAASDKRWFDCEGNLETLQNPCSKSSLRPIGSAKTNEELTIYVPPVKNAENACEEVVVHGENILLLHVGNVHFRHHPLFSVEHIFERKLIDLYEKYEGKTAANKWQRIQTRLESIRHARINLLNASGDDLQEKIERYGKEIKQMRETLFKEGKEYRRIIKSILQTWKAIKTIREKQGYSNTAIKLVIRKETVDLEAENDQYENMKKVTVEEVLNEHEEEYNRKLELYKKAIHIWKGKKGDEEKPLKPHKEFDEEVIREEIERQFLESFKPPGEPIVYFSINQDNLISADIENTKEKLRRTSVSSTKIYFKITCDKMVVCKSKFLMLDDKFSCPFEESFPMQLNGMPETIVIQIYEHPGSLLKRRIGEINLKVPMPDEESKHSVENFEQNEIVHYKHAGVGSGISLKKIYNEYELNVPKEDLLSNTSGFVSYHISWESKGVPPNKTEKSWRAFIDDKTGVIDVNKLIRWIEETRPDPQDPKNAIIYDYIKNYEGVPDKFESTRCFRLNPYAKQLLQFCDIDRIDNNLRLKVLKLRNQNEPEFVGMVVPNRLKEIPLSALSAYKRRLNEENEELFEDENEDESVDIKRSAGKKYLKQVHTKIFQKCRCAKNNLCFEDVVDEKYLSHFALFIKTLTSNFFNWFKLRPNISKPLPKIATKKGSEVSGVVDATTHTESKIIINVISATNLPSKKDGQLTPIVIVNYQNMTVETSSVESDMPVWNEELILPLESTHTDYLNPNSLNGTVFIHVFDDVSETDQEETTKKCWLGSVEIPISAICYSGKMEGLFKIKTPEMLFGYETECDVHNSNTATVSSAHFSYLSLRISIELNVIPKLHASMDELQCNEPPYLREHILKWNEIYNTSFSTRKFSALAIDVTGRTNCVTRYVRPLEPPQMGGNGFEITADQCAKYVSLIPFTNCNQFYQNIWLSTDQFLKITLGSVVDHAVVLVCYLTALNLDAWLVLGFGIPNGSTAYVMVREIPRDAQLPSFHIYDVVSGIKYSITDPYCPLQNVYCVINEYNVWANVQRNSNLSTTRFDFTRRMDWLQLFNNQISAPTSSIQSKLNYAMQQIDDEIEGLLYKKIRKKLMKMRKTITTRFDHELSDRIKHVLVNFEHNKMNSKSHFETIKELRIYKNHVRNGYVINMPYVNVQTAINNVKLLDIHSFANLDFGFAIYVHSYPNQVFSVWIFIATLPS